MLKNFAKSCTDEWKLAVKDKMIFIVLFAVPIIVNLLLGFEMSQNQMKNLPMAVCDLDNSSVSRTVVNYFAENETFNVKYYLNSSLKMEQLFNENKIRVGMIIPKDFGKDVAALKSPTILMLYDGSSMPMASAAKTKASEILLTLKTGILIKQIQARLNLPEDVASKMALAINFKNRTLYNPTRGYMNFLNIGLCSALIQSGIGILAASCIKSEKLPKEWVNCIGLILGKVFFYGILGTASLLLTIFIQKAFGIPFRGKFKDALFLCAGLSFCAAALGTVLSAWIKNSLISTVAAAVIFVPDTILVGYTWPLIGMPKFYQNLAYTLPFYHFADNFRDLMLKGLTASFMYDDFKWFCAFLLISTAAAFAGCMRLKRQSAGLVKEEGGRNEAL